MFSDHVKKVDKRPSRAMFVVVAGLAFISLLAVLVQVLNGQVEKAHGRQAKYDAAQRAMADCSTSYSGAARSQCIEQVSAALNPYSTYTPGPEVEAVKQHDQTSLPAVQGKTLATASAGVPGFMPAAFASQ